MLYGDEKGFEMARSILPSQARHSARSALSITSAAALTGGRPFGGRRRLV